MRRLLTALVVAGLAGFGLVAVTAGAAQAAPAASTAQVTQDEDCLKPIPQETLAPQISVEDFKRHIVKRACRQVELTDNCDGTVTVLVKNTGPEDSFVRFRIGDWESKLLAGGESDTTTVSKADSVGLEIESRRNPADKWRTYFVYEGWHWNASCLEVTSVSSCDGTFKVSVHNTSVANGEFIWSLGLEDTKTAPIEAGATLSENFTKGQIVQIRVGKDNELVKTLEWADPKNCATATPAPTTSAPAPPAATPDLPVTGAALQGTLWTGGALMLAVGAIIAFLVIRRRRDTISE